MKRARPPALSWPVIAAAAALRQDRVRSPTMSACPHVQQCSLYPMLGVRSLRLYVTDYCDREFDRCERFRRHRERRIVPMNLLPDGRTLGAEPAAAAETRKRE